MPEVSMHSPAIRLRADLRRLLNVSNNNNSMKATARQQRHSHLDEILWRSIKRAQVPATREPVGLFRSDGKRHRYPGPEANHWHGMLLSLTLMQTPTSIALQSLPKLQPIMQQQQSQPNMPTLYVYLHFRTVCHWNFGCVECSGHWIDPRNWQTHNSCHGWSTRDHSPLSTSFHCHPAGKCSLFYEHVQIWVRTISNRNCLIFSLRLCASGRKNNNNNSTIYTAS